MPVSPGTWPEAVTGQAGARAPAFDPLDRSHLRLLAEIGFLATERRWVEPARALFQALAGLRPDNVVPWIGLAETELAASAPAKAVRLLGEQVPRVLASDPVLACFRAWALQCCGLMDQARLLFEDVLARSAEGAPAARLASAFLADAHGGQAAGRTAPCPSPGLRA